jgi:hypothetical protein
MGITSEVSSIIYNSKEQFEKAMNVSLVNDVLRNIVVKSVPAEGNELEKINDPKFRESFNTILNPITQKLMDKYQSVGQFETGNLFTSMITSISDSVSLESAYRTEKLESQFLLDKIPMTASREWAGVIKNAFTPVKFTVPEIKNKFYQELRYILSTEAGDDVINQIKDEVKQSIDDAEDKNELVEGTLKEIADYKKEAAPPDDEYVDADNPDDNPDAETEEDEDSAEAGEDETGEGDTDIGSDDNIADADEPPDDIDTPDATDAGGDTPPADETDLDDENGLGGEGDDIENLNGDSDSEEGADGIDDVSDDALGGEGDDIENLGGDSDSGGDIPPAAGETETPDPNANIPNPPVQANQTKQGNVVININAADLVKQGGESFTDKMLRNAKKILPLYTASSFASTYVPACEKDLNNFNQPDVYTMASECVNALGDTKKELRIRFAGLKMSLDKGKISTEDRKILTEKYEKLSSMSSEAEKLADIWNRAFYKLGITQNGLLNSNESTLMIARNIISRFLTKTKEISPMPLQYTSKENILANAFDIVQLRQKLMNKEKPHIEEIKDLESRENVFYRNIANMDDKETKEKASAVIDLSDMKFEKAVTANFITDWKIKTWEQNVGKDQKDTNAEVVKRVLDKFESLWGRKLNEDEKKIVDATTNNRDVTEIIPTPYEKFLIKLSKENMIDKGLESGKPLAQLSPAEKADNRLKAKILTTILKSLERFNLIDRYDLMEFDKFCNMADLRTLYYS